MALSTTDVAPQSPKAEGTKSPKAQTPKSEVARSPKTQTPKSEGTKSPKVQSPKGTKSPETQSPQSRTGASPGRLTTQTFLPATYWTEAELPDDDSALGDDVASSTASIASSVLSFRTINGRRYHAERGNASYWAANDEDQSEAADLVDHVCRLGLNGGLYKAPLEQSELGKALDIGTGTGVWAIDFADIFPDCQVIGTDISPIQPSWVPPNLQFEIDDCTQPWAFPDNSFDYIHIRLLYGSVTNWQAMFDEAYRVLKPGGWLESHEASPMAYCDDGSLPEDSAIAQWGKFFIEGGEKSGRTFRLLEDDIQMENVHRIGLQNIGVFDFKTPLGAWPKDPVMNEAGRVELEAFNDAEGWLLYIANMVLDWTKIEVQVYCAHLRAEIRNTKIHSYFKQRVVWGQKPKE